MMVCFLRSPFYNIFIYIYSLCMIATAVTKNIQWNDQVTMFSHACSAVTFWYDRQLPSSFGCCCCIVTFEHYQSGTSMFILQVTCYILLDGVKPMDVSARSRCRKSKQRKQWKLKKRGASHGTLRWRYQLLFSDVFMFNQYQLSSIHGHDYNYLIDHHQPSLFVNMTGVLVDLANNPNISYGLIGGLNNQSLTGLRITSKKHKLIYLAWLK